MREKKNAVIEKATLTLGDRDILQVWLSLDYGGSGQGFGGHALALGPGYTKRDPKGEGSFCGEYLRRILEVAGVTEWSHLPGRTIRVEAEHSCIHGIGHIVKDDWFYPKELADKIWPPTAAE